MGEAASVLRRSGACRGVDMPAARSRRLAASMEARTDPPPRPLTQTATPGAAGGNSSPSMERAGPRRAPLQDRHVTETLSRVAQESRTLVVQELHLATSELTSKAKSAGMGAGLLGAAGIL